MNFEPEQLQSSMSWTPLVPFWTTVEAGPLFVIVTVSLVPSPRLIVRSQVVPSADLAEAEPARSSAAATPETQALAIHRRIGRTVSRKPG